MRQLAGELAALGALARDVAAWGAEELAYKLNQLACLLEGHTAAHFLGYAPCERCGARHRRP